MSDILATINESKRQEVAAFKQSTDLGTLKSQCNDLPVGRNFSATLATVLSQKNIAIIAEIKKASPSKGLIREDFNPETIAKSYEKAGATCLSVLTDVKYFQGAPSDLLVAKNHCQLPVLRKDFIIDEYQIYQSKLWGADAILLIAASLTKSELEDFEAIALEQGLSVLIELHHEDEIKKIEALQSPLIGINNRNLKTFAVDIEQTIALKPLLPPDKIIVCESGIHSHEDIQYMRQHEINTFLVGESLMRQPNIEVALSTLINGA